LLQCWHVQGWELSTGKSAQTIVMTRFSVKLDPGLDYELDYGLDWTEVSCLQMVDVTTATKGCLSLSKVAP